ncbi:unnamed protein product [Alternaria alternata]
MSLHIKTHRITPRNSIFENDAQKRGFIVVIILSVLATVGMFCLIISLVICKNKRDRKNKAAIVNAEMRMPGSKSRYRKLEDEEEAEGGIWSVEMDDRRPTAYKDGQQYGQIPYWLGATIRKVYLHIIRLFQVMFPYQKEKESTRLLREALEERMRTEHPFTAEQLQQFDDLKALLARVPKLSKADKRDFGRKATPLLQKRHESPKDIQNSEPLAVKTKTSLTPNSLFPLPPSSPLWPRPALQDPVSSATPEATSITLPHYVWVITQTSFGSGGTKKTFALCTTLLATEAVMAHLTAELANRIVLYIPGGAKAAQRTRFDFQTYIHTDHDFGFQACLGGGKKVAVDVKASWEEGVLWQGKMVDVRIFGEGFEEVTIEKVRAFMNG